MEREMISMGWVIGNHNWCQMNLIMGDQYMGYATEGFISVK